MDRSRDIEPEKIVEMRRRWDLAKCEWVPTPGDFYEIFMGYYSLDHRGEIPGLRLVVINGERKSCDLCFYAVEFRSIVEKYGEMNSTEWQRRYDREAVEERNKNGGFKKLGGD